MRAGLVFATGVVGVLGGFPLPAADLVVPVVLVIRSKAAQDRTELTLTNRGKTAVELALSNRGRSARLREW